MALKFFEYGQLEVDYLKNRDPKLAVAVEKIGHIYRPVTPDLFAALINSIVGQQISNKAQKTICLRMQSLVGSITPKNIDAVSPERLQQCGMTMKKAHYMKGVASKVISGELDIARLPSLPDDDVSRILSSLNGVGVWTAEMLMTFPCNALIS